MFCNRLGSNLCMTIRRNARAACWYIMGVVVDLMYLMPVMKVHQDWIKTVQNDHVHTRIDRILKLSLQKRAAERVDVFVKRNDNSRSCWGWIVGLLPRC